jgi:hypothetical protein
MVLLRGRGKIKKNKKIKGLNWRSCRKAIYAYIENIRMLQEKHAVLHENIP